MTGVLRLALVRQRYTPFGGAERFIARALPALDRAGISTTLIARDWQGSRDAGWGARSALKVDPFYLGRTWRDASFARAARAAWRHAGFDLVQSHERIPGCDIYRAGDGVHRSWLNIRAARASLAERLRLRLNPYHRYVCAAERAMFEHERLRAVICNSMMVRNDIQRSFRIDPEKLHLVYNGIDLEQFHPARRAALREAARAELGVSPRDTVFLFVGSGFARKGLDAAIDGLARAAHPGFRLVVAGRDRDAPRYAGRAARANLSTQLRMLGAREDVRPLYAAADCLILPTRYDPFPNTVLESLAMGVPAIVGRDCGAAEIVRHGATGWICDPDDIESIAQHMHAADRATRDPALADAVRASVEPYGIDLMAERLVALYRSLA